MAMVGPIWFVQIVHYPLMKQLSQGDKDMKPYQINLATAAILIVFGLWGYLSSADPSPTAFIPVAFGAVLALLTPGMRNESKVVAHVVVLLTLVLVFALIVPLRGAFNRDDLVAASRVGIMLLASVIATIVYVRSFIAARRSK